ncbi:hypothetical protein NQT62_12305 [Limnobacter humi]|uniref:HNH endonuclease n=1 Tax=Limnobacter humi TaxID=1778671 RepID=A0ABT1WK78_9BURK|nr:hypothetical protein [Limnobacter humi]MCQ8897217.1 hypothetical protein [Limnobacter humi]
MSGQITRRTVIEPDAFNDETMRLPPNYYYGSDGPRTPAFFGTTAETVEAKHLHNAGTQAVGKQVFYRCIYCQHDPRLQSLMPSRGLHPRELMQIDHIVPFSIIQSHVTAYYTEDDYRQLALQGFVPNPDFGMATGWNNTDPLQLALLYNDIDNLHLSCTAHNQEKGNTLDYLGLSAQFLRQSVYPNP